MDTSSPVVNPVFDDVAARRSATLKLLEVVLGLALHSSAGWIRCAKHSPTSTFTISRTLGEDDDSRLPATLDND
jgi:hypothetical protein